MSLGMRTTSLLALTLFLAAPRLPAGDGQLTGIIDSHIARRSGGSLSPVSDDAEFFRRIHLDLAGIIPTAGETRKFLADASPGKRTALADRLLAGKDFSVHWADLLSVELLKRQNLGKVPPQE